MHLVRLDLIDVHAILRMLEISHTRQQAATNHWRGEHKNGEWKTARLHFSSRPSSDSNNVMKQVRQVKRIDDSQGLVVATTMLRLQCVNSGLLIVDRAVQNHDLNLELPRSVT